ncbi:MAG: citrate synthase [Acidimicrobiia bacterium]|nr:citrate synthase [Acidimicrobiia bacterium]
MTDATAKLRIADKDHELSTVPSTIGDVGLDIGALRSDTGFVTFDPGYANTASTESNITYIDGGNGTLWHRGYKIEDLAENCGFLEVAYLLLFGELPDQDALDAWRAKVRQHTLLNEELKRFFDAFPRSAHPMAILSSATNAISTFYEAYYNPKDPDAVRESATRLIAKMPTVAAWAYKKSIGQPYIYPRNDLSYVENFLHMMFALPVEDSPVDKVVAQALNVLLILHADHGQNCSTATVRFVGSSQANLFASVAAGMNALWGPLHGGANQEVVEMLHAIHVDPDMTVEKAVSRAKDKNDPYRLMGFGHRIYRNYDPRAKILKRFADDVLGTVSRDDPLLEIANHLEKVALEDDYFVSRKLYPNVDFYSGLIFRALGFPTRMFTVLFAIGRLPGWIANWMEMHEHGDNKIARPRQIYTGEALRDFVPIAER